MSTIRPFLSSGVRPGVVPENNHSDLSTEHEEVLECVDSIELEGSCELMNSMEADTGNHDDEMKRHNEEQRYKMLLKKWRDYFNAVNMDGGGGSSS